MTDAAGAGHDVKSMWSNRHKEYSRMSLQDNTQYERNTFEKALDAGGSFDWITPAYAIMRNAFGDGQTIIVDSDLWAPLHAQLERFGVDVWSVSIQWIDVAYFAVFSIHAEDLPRVNHLLGNYGQDPVKRLPRWRAWLALALVVLVMLTTAALALALNLIALIVGAP